MSTRPKERTDDIELAEPKGPPDVRLEAVRKSFGDVVAVDGVNLEIPVGEFFTLRALAGIGNPSQALVEAW